jgi:hypothetical protein
MQKVDYKLLHKITKDFTEVKPLLAEHKKAKAKFKQVDRKINTIDKKYSFLLDVIGIEIDDDKLCDAVKTLFKKAGFEKVVHYKDKRKKPKREDLQLYFEDELFVLEVKGISAVNPGRADVMQVFPYIAENRKRQQDKKVYGFTIINHDKKNHPTNRPKRFKDEERENDAINCGYGFISTIDLVIGFQKLKQQSINFDQFKEQLKQTGMITFDSKGGKTSTK